MAAFAVGSAARAAPPLEVYGRLPAVDLVDLAPGGESFALVARDGDARRLFVRKTDGTPVFVAAVGDSKVRDIQWIGDDQLVVFGSSTMQLPDLSFEKMEWTGGVHIDLNTKASYILMKESHTYLPAMFGWYGQAQIGDRWYGYFADYTYEQIAPTYQSRMIWPDLYRMDMATGKVEKAAPAGAGDTDWAIGPDGALLATGAFDARGQGFKLAAGKWGGPTLLTRSAQAGDAEVHLAGLGRTPGTVLVRERNDQDTVVREIQVSQGGEGEVVTHGDVELLRGRLSRQLIGWREGSNGAVHMFDPALQRRVDASRKAFPGLNVTLVSYDETFDHLVMLTDGSDDSGTYWLVDIPKKSARRIDHANPLIKPEDVGPVRMIQYKAADGLELDGALTLPPGGAAKNLPLVVLPHGGPIVLGDGAQFDWWAQAFASRGYAVFQPNYRGTLGHGEAFRKAAYGELGRKMQTDVSDGVAALAAQGIIDPKRACIVGASYGGYAALAGVTLQHGLYRCAVSVAGVGDFGRMITWDSVRDGSDMRGVNFWRDLSGASAGQNLADISPVRQAARADAPILLIHGLDDTVVPIEQSKMMEKALKAAGKPVEFVTMAGEDHWLSKEPSRKAMLAAAVAFVEKHNPAN
ncbi:S9 family peptidase [Phenylobacterium aquaticum]|uniref:alpha/beta hydrolase family protein n=1 Tax=Phenylobacterium aquaticum TaxID=1763816 RepID=UPI0026EA51AE|nr:S9 family peptidase [Phenylobacterium aquaticum]